MAWATLDLDGVIWDAATGLAAVAEIHTAIKERAVATSHPIRLTTFADDFEGDVWLSEPVDGFTGRQFLKTLLEGFYEGIVDLVEGDENVGFTTASAGDTLWTMETLIADMALGEFADTLLGPQYYHAFLWLREALDRLIYARRMRGVVQHVATGGTPTLRSVKSADVFTDADDAWAAMLSDSPTTSTADGAYVLGEVFWFFLGSPQFRGRSQYLIERARLRKSALDIDLSGTWTRAEWQVSPTGGEPNDVTISTVDISIDGEDAVSCAIDDDTFIDASSTAIPLTGDREDVSFEIDPIPASLPFDGTDGLRTGLGSFGFNIPKTWVWFDISGELADQA